MKCIPSFIKPAFLTQCLAMHLMFINKLDGNDNIASCAEKPLYIMNMKEFKV